MESDPFAGETGEWTRQAIDIMTAWAAEGDDRGFVASRVAHYTDEDSQGAMKLNVGFINLSAILLLQLRAVTGTDTGALLRDAAGFTL